MIFKQFSALFYARTMEFVRDRGTFVWNLVFPVILVLGLGFAFSGGEEALFKVGVVGNPDPAVALVSMEQVQVIPYPDAVEALQKLERHQIDFLVDFERREFALNETSSKGRLVRDLFLAQEGARAATEASTAAPAGEASGGVVAGSGAAGFTPRAVSGQATRYVDWLVPGVIGMNIMMSSLFGVGYVLVRYRKNGVLKRFKATPIGALTFVGAQSASRLVIVLLTSVVVFTGTDLILNFVMRGSWIDLLVLTALGILCMISLGLVFASRMKSEEMAGGVLNLVTFPMLALSGVFFSLEGSPPILQSIARVFPLTHFIDGARKIMLDGAGLLDILPSVAVLGGLTAVFLVISAALFKWE